MYRLVLTGIHEVIADVSERRAEARVVVPIIMEGKRRHIRDVCADMEESLLLFPRIVFTILPSPGITRWQRWFGEVQWRFALSGPVADIQTFLRILEFRYGN